VDAGRWQQLALVMGGGVARAFKNGTAPTGTMSYATFGPGYAPWIGKLNGATAPAYFLGSIDEVRISSTARSADWVWAEYMTAASNAAFTAYSLVVDAQTEDVNGDGIPDAWQRHYFSDGGPGSAPGEDWDKDGAVNRAEYIAGTDPTNPASVLYIADFRARSWPASVSFLSSSGRMYRLESCRSLTDGVWSNTSDRETAGDGGVLWLSDTNDRPADCPLLRVRARLP